MSQVPVNCYATETANNSTPVLMTDPTSLEALSKVVDRLRNLRVLLIPSAII
jgi:hypothetical protein